MQSYSEKFQKEIVKYLRISIISILTLALVLVGWLIWRPSLRNTKIFLAHTSDPLLSKQK